MQGLIFHNEANNMHLENKQGEFSFHSDFKGREGNFREASNSKLALKA